MKDSTVNSLLHIKQVAANITNFVIKILYRASVHDNSKLEEPEKSINDEWAQQLYQHEYGSANYLAILKKMEVAVKHHHKHNSHHPEYYGEAGIYGMDLYDLVEMYCDWKAACERIPGGSFIKSLEVNRIRYDMNPQLYQIFKNTIERNQ